MIHVKKSVKSKIKKRSLASVTKPTKQTNYLTSKKNQQDVIQCAFTTESVLCWIAPLQRNHLSLLSIQNQTTHGM